MDRFLAIDAFVRVAESRSFAQAARQMRVSRSVVTARIQQLEDFVGAPLFHRNTRSVRLSELGHAFLRDCSELVGRTNEVVDQMREVGGSPTREGAYQSVEVRPWVWGLGQPKEPDDRLAG